MNGSGARNSQCHQAVLRAFAKSQVSLHQGPYTLLAPWESEGGLRHSHATLEQGSYHSFQTFYHGCNCSDRANCPRDPIQERRDCELTGSFLGQLLFDSFCRPHHFVVIGNSTSFFAKKLQQLLKLFFDSLHALGTVLHMDCLVSRRAAPDRQRSSVDVAAVAPWAPIRSPTWPI